MTSFNEEILSKMKRHADLGHSKRTGSLLRQLKILFSSPGTSPTQAAGRAPSPVAQMASLYRFLDNPSISVAALRKIRAQAVLDTIPPDSEVLIVHDVTLLDYCTHTTKTDRRPIGDGKGLGYEYASCAAVEPVSRRFLGIIHDTLISSNGPDDQKTMKYDYEPLFSHFSESEKARLRVNHRHQMAVHVNGLESQLGERHVIHVGDREFDDIFLLAQCLKNNHDFVIRSTALRNVQIPNAPWIPPEALTRQQGGGAPPEGWVCVNLTRLIHEVPPRPYKTLHLDARGRVTDSRTAHRSATLHIGACRVRLYRRAKRNTRYHKPPNPVELSMVIIRECDPPQGLEPLLWVLFTSLPVDTDEQLGRVGTIYECRWIIEEFHRLLKSGYKIEQMRMDNADKIAKLLILFSVAAMTLGHMKSRLGLPRGGYLDDEQYQRVKKAMKEPDNTAIDIELRLFAFIAKLGGWLGRRRDPIGPTVLMRGLLQVLAILDALEHYEAFFKEVIRKRQKLK